MLTSKRSPRKSDAFRSRFLDAAHEAAPLRAARQLREHLAGELVQAVLQAGFIVALVLFGRSLWHLFEKHGGHLDPWYLRLSLAAVGITVILVGRRLIRRIVDIRETRQELAVARQQLDALRERNRRPTSSQEKD